MATRIISKSFPQLFESTLVSSDEDIDLSELREYYSDFFQPEYSIKTQIISTKTIEAPDEKYTVYVIHIKLPFTEYIIEKRYTQFLELYKKVERNYKNVSLHRLSFPAKRFFGSFNDTTIQHRKSLLDRFLIFLSENYKKEAVVEFLEFLEIKKRIEMLIRLPTVESAVIVTQDTDKTGSDVDLALSYLRLFNRNTRNLCRSFKEFESSFFESRPKFSRQAVKKLFYGTEEFDGFIHLCGKCDPHTNSHLTCGSGLQLLIRLLDYECNRDAELFNQVFGSTSLRDIMGLYFDSHIQVKGFKPCKVAAMKLLNIFVNYNPSISINQILIEDEVRQEFEVWKASQQTTSIKAESYFKF